MPTFIEQPDVEGNFVNYRHLLTLTVMHLLLPAWALADDSHQEGANKNNDATAIVISSPSSIENLWTNSGNYSAIQQDAIEQTSHTHIGQLLSQVPGTWVSIGSGQEHLTAIRSPSLTGSGACGSFLFMQDGIPLRPAGFCNANNLIEVNTEQAERIEVIRGPASAVFGGGALNGLVNVVSPAPASEDQTRFTVEGGPYDFARIKLSNTQRVDDSALRIDFNTAQSNGYRDASDYDQQKLSLRMDNVYGDWRNSTFVNGTQLNQHTGAYVVGDDAYKNPDLKRSNPNPDAYRDAWSSRLVSQFSRQFDQSTLSLSPYWRRSQMDFLMHYLPGTPTEFNEQTSYGVQGNLAWPLAGKHRLNAGLNIEQADIALQEFQNSPELFGTLPYGKHYDFDVKTRDLSASFGADWALSSQWHFINKLHVENLFYDYDNNMLSGNTRDDGGPCTSAQGCRYTRPDDRSDRFVDAAAKLGLSYDWNDSTQLFTSVGSGFRPPQVTDLYRLQAGQVVANIDSERLDSLELGINRSAPEYDSQLVFFLQKEDNVIYVNSDRLIYNDGATRSEGLELSLNYHLNKEQDLIFAGSYAEHRYENAWGNQVNKGDLMQTAPRQIGQVRWLYKPEQILEGKSRWELELNHIGAYYMDASNDHSYPGHTLLNARSSYQLNPAMQVSARLENIANANYAERADFAFGSERYFPGTPRALFVAWQYLL